jgi:hypothetical protein
VLLYSEPRQPQAQRTVDTQWRKQSDQEVRAFKPRFKGLWSCAGIFAQAVCQPIPSG